MNKWMNQLKGIAGCLTALFYLCSCSNTATHLISNGKSDYKIFVSEKAIAPEKYAAEELQTYLHKVSGCNMEITHNKTDEAKLIYVGFQETPSSLTANLNISDFGNEEYIIRSDGKSLLIAGGATRGTLYGVIGYLSDYLGCRWYTKDVIKIPPSPSVSLPKIEDRQKPAFEYREVYWREAYDTAWEVHNRQDPSGLHIPDSMGGTYITHPFVHTFYALVSPEKYFHTHPEYFSEINGKRVGKDAQLCLTNPDVLKVAIATVFDWIKANPKANVFSIDQNDGEGYCECKYCKELDDKEGSHSGTLINFVNQIADTISKAYPKIKLQTLAYAYTVVPPKHIRPADNVMIRLCHYNDCAAHPIEGCVVNKPYLDQMNQWEHIAKEITIWEYYTDFQHYFLPFPNFESFSHDIKFYADRKVKGIFAEGTSGAGGDFAQLKSWVIAQLMWNPNQDAWHLIIEYVDNVYGEAAPYITSYIRLLHDRLGKDAHLDIWAEPFEVSYLDQTTIRKADSLFTLAKAAAAKDTALADRVEFAYLPILYTKLYYFSQGGTSFFNREEMPAALSRFKNILERHHISSIAEDSKTYGNLEKFLERIQLASNSEFYTDWQVIGPFDNEDQQGLTKVYPPEKEFDSTQVYTGVTGQKITWKKYDNNTTGYIDFNKLFSPSENVVAYARKIITLPEAQTMKFGVGNNDGIRIWINEKLVFNQATAVKGPNQHTFIAHLNKGQNVVLLKVSQLKHAWGFYFTHLPL